MTESFLTASNISVCLGGRTVLNQISLQLGKGWTAVVGPNGAGKSTLLRTLAGLQPCHGGEVQWQGQVWKKWGNSVRAQQLAWSPQQSDVSTELTVHEVVHLGRLPHLGLFSTPGPKDESLVQAAMAATECTEWQHHRLNALSGGERQRVLLARALAVDASVLLLDEPTTHLDPPHQMVLVRLLKTQAHAGRTVVSVLHDLNLALCADRIVLMQQGQVVATGQCDDPTLHAALEAVFLNAIRIERLNKQWVMVPNQTGA
jgi:iron complex transport system ATP-binding protein